VRLLILALCLSSLTSSAFAQYGGGMMGGRRGGGAMGMPSSRPVPSEGLPSPGSTTQMLADKLYDLRMRLLITTEQSDAWDLFYNRTMAWMGEPMRAQGYPASPTAVQAAQQRVALWLARAHLMEQIGEAVKTLYALSLIHI